LLTPKEVKLLPVLCRASNPSVCPLKLPYTGSFTRTELNVGPTNVEPLPLTPTFTCAC
jgi:hypothetical protein